MTPPVVSPSFFFPRLCRVGLVCGVVDALWAMAQTMWYQRPAWSVWQRVAATPFGPSMLTGGFPAVVLGLGLHFTVALGAAAAFLLVQSRSAALRRVMGTPAGMLSVAAAYGPVVWITMSVVVIPLMTGRPPAVTGRWFVELGGHIVFVGLPIVWAARRWAHEAPLTWQNMADNRHARPHLADTLGHRRDHQE